jgi:predicted amidohydrolase
VENYDLLIYIASFPRPRIHAWKTLLLARAIENQCFTIGVNRIGEDGTGLSYSGDSCLVDYEGNLLFSESDKEAIKTFSLDIEKQQAFRQKLPFLKDQDIFQYNIPK